MADPKQSMKGVEAGRDAKQRADGLPANQQMDDVTAKRDASQEQTNREQNRLSIPGLGSATGIAAIVVLGLVLAAWLIWKLKIAK
jgi:hypothetical protein